MATQALKRSLKIGMIPADGIGREVLPVSHPGSISTSPLDMTNLYIYICRSSFLSKCLFSCDGQASQRVFEALGSSIPKVEFVPLLAGWDYFQKTGVALPEETIR